MKKQRPVVPFMPWTWLPPQVMMGKMADKIGLINTPEGMPSAPAPMRLPMTFMYGLLNMFNQGRNDKWR